MAKADVIKQVSTYLKIPVTDISKPNEMTYCSKNKVSKGFIGVLSSLAKDSPVLNKSCHDDIIEAQIRQWVEYALLYVIPNVQKPEQSVLKELNAALSTKSYFVGDHLSVADIVMFYSIRPLMSSLNPHDGFIHLARWFDHLQKDDTLSQGKEPINLNAVFLLYHAH